MSGKPYTLREMKTIVEYLTEHKAYGEIKGRKMWKDLADSKITTRTWQSLKETFLKRILPDIHNPYYKLSLHQISSFRQGHDVEARLNNKLQIQSVSHDSNTDGEDKEKNPDANKTNNKDETKGEDIAQIENDVRASTETLVLDDCDENAEDELPKKSLRDLITYSEPLTPMLQAVVDDFASDKGEGSNDEFGMQIVESPDTELNDDSKGKETAVTDVDSLNPVEPQKPTGEVTHLTTDISASPRQSSSEIPSSNLKINTSEKITENGNNEDVSILLSDNDEIPKNKDEKENSIDGNKPKTSLETIQNTNTTTDTLLPDNQEGFKENSQIISVNNKNSVKNNTNSKRAKKRSNSQNNQSTVDVKKRFTKKKQSISDTDIPKTDRNISNISGRITFKQNISEEPEKQLNPQIDDVVEDSPPKRNEEEEKHKKPQSDENISEEFENPCLKSVSLYAEQFSNTKYTDSEISNIEDDNKNKKIKEQPQTTNTINVETKLDKKHTENKRRVVEVVKANETNKEEDEARKKKIVTNKTMTEPTNDIVVLKSHSDSPSDKAKEKPTLNPKISVKQQRREVMADMFDNKYGSSGHVKRTRQNNSYRKRTSTRNQILNVSSDSSDWTSDWESEYVSPPRGRKNRQTRKYLKPKSARVLSLEEEGGLFVMYGKKVYPVVKDGKIIKNYVTYTPDNECDQEESFWKLKYVEEKKRTAELTKLLTQVSERTVPEETRVPIQPSTSRNQAFNEIPTKPIEISDNKMATKDADEHKSEPAQEGKTVKIKFTKNNEEVQLEGHWSHVNPVLAQVIQLFQKDPELTSKEIKTKQQPDPVPEKRILEETEPLKTNDNEVLQKINQIESEIFKEIEERDVRKSPTPKEMPQKENIVVQRRGRPRKSQTNVNTEPSPSSVKKPTVVTRKSTQTLRKRTMDKSDETEISAKKPVVESPKDSENDVRYKLRTTPPTTSPTTRRSSTNKSKVSRLRKSNSSVNLKIYSSPENLSLHSVESTQGYADSDDSPIKTYMRKKKTSFSIPSYRSRNQISFRKKNHPYMTDDITSESSQSNSMRAPVKTMTFQNTTLKSEEYKSESYQLLMNNKNVTIRSKSSHLERIDETSSLSIDMQYVNEQICKEISDVKIYKEVEDKENLNTDSSSNVTLPTSPVLSIVENISINKSMINNSNDFPIEEEVPNTEPREKVMLNEYMNIEDDVSMPLMEQECGIESRAQKGTEFHYNINITKATTPLPESVLKKINIVNIEDPTLSESFQSKLRDLALDSTKKTYKDIRSTAMENKDSQNEDKLCAKVTKSRNRSSTPRKRQSTRKLKLTNNEPCIEEEHMETCSYTGRKSCPPVIQIFEDFDTATEMDSVLETNSNKPKGKKKNDIIKVKIMKPKTKRLNKETVEKRIESAHGSIQTDSGINDTESSALLNTFNHSVDLIHNHSETCLNANECLGDSVEIIKNSTNSIISLESNSTNIDHDLSLNNFKSLPNQLINELLSDDAKDVSVLQKVIGAPEFISCENTCATVYRTPVDSLSPPNSLMTEDLSNEVPEKSVRNTKWYFFSEDEVSNSNITEINQNSSGYGANLNEIFPITCAIPNLSTITEMSKENENSSKKFGDDTNTRNDLDSPSLFN